MNTNGLARHYDALTSWERVPLIVAATARGDDAEAECLARSAPRHRFLVPDYFGLVEGLQSLTMLYVLRQLEIAAEFENSLDLLDLWALESLHWDEPPADERCQRLWKLARVLAYQLVTRADGWKLLCQEMHLDPEVLPRLLPGFEKVRRIEDLARTAACTAEEALAYFRERFEAGEAAQGKTPTTPREWHIDTAADVARSMREELEEQAGNWS
jgi:hypothetical protein